MSRDLSIDYIRGLAIFLVVVGHFIQGNSDFFLESGSNSKSLFEIIYSFHMPLFFILSGYVSALKKEKICNLYLLFTYVKKKAVLLLLPKFAWVCLFTPIMNHKKVSIQTLFYDFIDLKQFWFLNTLFIIFVGYALYRYVSSKKNSGVANVVGALLALLVIELISLVMGERNFNTSTIVSILLYPSFFIIGYIFKLFSVVEMLKKNNWLLALVFASMVFGMENYEFPGCSFINCLYKYLASVGFFIVAKECFQSIQIPCAVSKCLLYCSKHSLGIYCVHMFFIWDICSITTDSMATVLALSSVVSLLMSFCIIAFAEFLSPLKYISIFLFGRVNVYEKNI